MAEDKVYKMRHSGEQVDDAVDASGKYREQDGYVKVIVDKNNKIMFAITTEGKVFIPQMTTATLEYIVHNMSQKNFKLDKIDNNTSFDLPVETNACIRFKFKVNESLVNSGSAVEIASFDAAKIKSKTLAFSQYTKDDNVFPTLKGGVTYINDTNYDVDFPFAFAIKYVGSSTDVTISNNGTSLTISVNGNATNYTLSNYESVYDLYTALSAREDLEVLYKEMEGHTCDELAIFPSCSLVNTIRYKGSTLVPAATWDNVAAPFFVPYAIDTRWHQVEIVKVGSNLYWTCDGRKYQSNVYGNGNILKLGSASLNAEFKDIEVSLDTCLDAEIADGLIVSSVNPCLIIIEGHGMYDKPMQSFNPDGSTNSQEAMGCSADRLYYVFRKMISMGYVPVTINDITAYYNGEKPLPKRAFTAVFDDFRWDNCLNLSNRRVFCELGVYPNLAIIYDRTDEITFDGAVITKKEAAEICLRNNFGLLNHLDHCPIDSVNPANLLSKIKADIIGCDKILVDGTFVVYPGGNTNKYANDTLAWLGCKFGLSTYTGSYTDTSLGSERNNGKWRGRYDLRRIEVGSRTTFANVINNII